MRLLIATLLILIVETALATFVATRAWDHRPARLFVLPVAVLMALHLATFARTQAASAQAAYANLAVSAIVLAVLDLALLWLFSALFLPEWWEGNRPIRWISLPYALVTLAVGADLFGGAGMIVSGVRVSDGAYMLATTRPGGTIALALFSASWLVHLGVLGFAFARRPALRPVIALLFLAIVAGSTLGLFADWIGLPGQVAGLIQAIPLLAGLAYAVFRTRLFTSTRAALDLALRAMSESVVVLDSSGGVVYANPRAMELGIQSDLPIAPALAAAGADPSIVELMVGGAQDGATVIRTLTLGRRRVELARAPVVDAHGRSRGTLLLGRDVTELERRNALIEQERAQLAETVEQLQAAQHERARLADTVRELSLPLIPVLDGVLVLPVVGAFDSARADEFMDVLLRGIAREHAQLVLLDITGVPLLDADGAAALLRGVHAAALLGARCVLVGARPELAQSLVALGAPLDTLATAATLQEGLRNELRELLG